MQKNITRQELLESFKLLESQFEKSLEKAKDHEAEFEALRKNLINQLDDHLRIARNTIPESNPLKQQIVGFINVMEKTKSEWDAKIAGRKKGVEFRKGFEDSLLVFVNGKVKSGKSSLGNYMAWGHTDPDENLKRQVASSLVPKYESHENTAVSGGDSEHEAQRQKEFRVGATEATSSIQSFKLPGITWVDSPGMHSLKVENELLARDYVEHADLILYTMKSDAPGRESDLTEIKHLLIKEKKLLLLLTGSDDIDEDIDDVSGELVQTVVMKTPERCERQRDYVRKALDASCGAENTSDIEIVSFSARYAQINTTDPAAFRESGMGLLCETLHRISQSDGVRIKQRTPIKNMQNFVASCRGDLQPYSALLSGFRKPLDELKLQSQKKINLHIRDGQDQICSFIEEFFDRISRRDDEHHVSKQLSKFQSALDEKIRGISFALLEKIFDDLMTGFKETIESTISRSELVKLPDFKLEKIDEQIPMIKSGTEKRNSLFGAIIGGGLGLLLGPAGAAAGATLGGTLGKSIGSKASVNYRSIEVTVGDNLQEILQQTIRHSEKILEEKIIKASNSLWGSMEKDVDGLLVKLRHEIAEFEDGINKLQLKIELS